MHPAEVFRQTIISGFVCLVALKLSIAADPRIKIQSDPSKIPHVITAQTYKTPKLPVHPEAPFPALDQNSIDGWKPTSLPDSGSTGSTGSRNSLPESAEWKNHYESQPSRKYQVKETHAEYNAQSLPANYYYPEAGSPDRLFLPGQPLSSYLKEDNAVSSVLVVGAVVLIAFLLAQPYVTYNLGGRRKRSNDIDWESLNILDYISMMEEMWRKFDVKDMACQKRVICEIHQNEASFGPGASKIVKAFSYIQYLSLFSLPEAVRDMVHEYRDAAEKARDVGTDCGKVFDSCEFSFKDTFAKYLANDKK